MANGFEMTLVLFLLKGGSPFNPKSQELVMTKSRVLVCAFMSFASAGAFASAPVPLDRKDVRIDYASTTLVTVDQTPRRIVLSGHVVDTTSFCTSTHTIERTYIGCSVEDGQPNHCVQTFTECATTDFHEIGRSQKVVLKFKGELPRPGTEIRIEAKDKDGYFRKPTLISNDPCLKFEFRTGPWYLERRKPLILVRNEC